MLTSLMSSKLQPPPARRELLARPHMIERLNSTLWNGEVFTRKVTLVCASAGSGKTTLVADWLRNCQYPYAWLSLDEHENDPSRFLSYLIAAFMQVDARLGDATRRVLQDPQPPPPVELLAILIREITAYGGPLILALDDYHVIQTPTVHQQTNFLIEYQPINLHLVMVTREDPPIPVSRLRGRSQLLEVRQGDLRFSLEECDRFLIEAMGLELSADQVAALARRTEGWAVGLQLAALALRGVSDPGSFILSFSGSHRYILDYLLDEVLNRQPDSVQQFLLMTSILERLTGSLCDAVTGRKDSTTQLQALDASNLFIFPLDQTRTWYRYHRLFTELLRHRLQLQPDVDVRQLHQIASRWCEENQQLQEAVQHSLAAEDWSRASQLIYEQSETLLKNGELGTLINWCQRLPEQTVSANPRLCLAYAWPLLLRSQAEPAAKLLAQAESLTDAASVDSTFLGEIAAAQAFLAQTQGNGARLIAYSEKALTLLPNDRLSHRSVVSLNLGLAYWHMGKLEAADKALKDALRDGLATGNHYASLTARIFLARSLAVHGQLHQAQEQLLEILKLPARPPIMTLVFLDLAILYYEWNDLTLAEEYLTQGVQAAQRSGNPEFQVAACLFQARLRSAQRKPGQALAAIQEAENIVATGKIPSRTQERIDVLKAELSLGTVQTLQERGSPTGNVDAHPFYRFLGLGETRRLLAQGQKPAAAAQLANLVKVAEPAGWTYGLVILHILQALAAENALTAVEFLSKALDLGQPQEFLRSFMDAGPQLIPLLQQAAQRGIHPLYIGEILAALQAKPATLQVERRSRPGSTSIEDVPIEELSERELEVLRLMAAGLSNRQIASQLVLSLGTVKTHLHNIYGKLEARNRPQAVDRARKLELL